MTTLVAYQGDGFCVLAADSQTTGYGLASDCSPMGKIAQNGEFVIAAAGLVRGMNIMQHSFIAPRVPKIKPLLEKFMVARFIPELRKTFIESGYEMKDYGEVASHDNDIIVAVRGKLFFIDDVYGLEYVSNRLYCGGSGHKLALGAAHALGGDEIQTIENAVEILVRAVKTSIAYDVYSGGRVQVFLQSDKGINETFFRD